MSTHRSLRRAVLVAAPLALALAGCGGGGGGRARVAFDLEPTAAPTSTTVVPPTTSAKAARTTSTQARTAERAPASSVPAAAAAAESAAGSTSVPGRGIAVRVPGTASASASSAGSSGRPAAVATTPRPTAAGGTTTPPTVLLTPTTAPALQLDVPASAALPAGPFAVAVPGVTAFDVTAGPAGVCTADGARVVPQAVGDCVVRASAPGRSPAQTTVQVRRGDPTVGWQLGARTAFSYNPVLLDLAASSGAPVTATAATGACRLLHPTVLSFVPASGAPQLGQCTLTVVVDETPEWNGRTTTLTTATFAAPVAITFDAPASATTGSFAAKVVLTQADRSLDTRLAFGVQAGAGCALAGPAAVPDAATRTAVVKLSGTVPATHWCVLTVVPRGGDAAGVVATSGGGCRVVWVGPGTPSGTRPKCPA